MLQLSIVVVVVVIIIIIIIIIILILPSMRPVTDTGKRYSSGITLNNFLGMESFCQNSLLL